MAQTGKNVRIVEKSSCQTGMGFLFSFDAKKNVQTKRRAKK